MNLKKHLKRTNNVSKREGGVLGGLMSDTIVRVPGGCTFKIGVYRYIDNTKMTVDVAA